MGDADHAQKDQQEDEEHGDVLDEHGHRKRHRPIFRSLQSAQQMRIQLTTGNEFQLQNWLSIILDTQVVDRETLVNEWECSN